MCFRITAACGAVLLAVSPLAAADIDYERDIKPLLTTKCSSCHGALEQEAGLRLDAGELIRAGGDGGPVIDLDDPEESLILARVASDDPYERMPPEGEGEPLTAEQIELLQRWIAGGAVSPEDEPVPQGPEEHWAYLPPQRPSIDDASTKAANPIDALHQAKLEARGLHQAPPADRVTLVRRIYLDVLGLPPTPAQIDAFAADESPDAWPRLVDRLLADPAYGERWGRHWMDVWRYSDWDGYKDQLRGSQRHIWRWREWILDSVCADKGYDQMIREMLAGDEIAPNDINVLAATGFLARNYHNSNRNIWLDATVEHTAKAFLAMTIDCARCHDHKYDPLAQQEYYQLRAVFEPYNVRVERVPGERDTLKDGIARVYDAELDAKTYLYIGGNEKHFDEDKPVGAGLPSIVDLPFEPSVVALPDRAAFPALRDFHEREDTAAAAAAVDAARKRLAELRQKSESDPGDGTGKAADEIALAKQQAVAAEANLASLQARWNADKAKYGDVASELREALARAAAAAERIATLEQRRATLLEQQAAVAAAKSQKDEKTRAAAAEKAEKAVAEAEKAVRDAEEQIAKGGAKYTPVGETYPAASTGRRRALAGWITDERNPLTARVAVNHIWLRHFGQPLVENVFDFGLRSPAPLHQDILDWLACDFVEHDWSMKHLHRRILTSDLYRQASSVPVEIAQQNVPIDPDNRYAWRFISRRLEAEAVRDSVLAVAGGLDRTRGGAEIAFERGEKVPRRSLYFQHAYEKQMTMLVTFDAASPTECYRRSESIVPQQALALSNSDLALSQARSLARRLSQRMGEAPGEDENFVQQAFRHVLGRACSADELSACQQFLQQQTEQLSEHESLTPFGSGREATVAASAEPRVRARENLVHVLMNHNDFVTIR